MDERHLATPHDRTIPRTPASLQAWTNLLTSILSNVPSNFAAPLCLVQISHAGLQSSSTINFSRASWTPAIAPCVARPDTGSSLVGWIAGHLIWPTKSAEIADSRDWLDIVDMFVGSAKLVEKAGWDGVQIHSAHGYLLAEFLSPLVCIGIRRLKSPILMSRPTRVLDPYQASLLRFRTAYTYSTLSCHDCKTRPTRNSSKPSR